MEGEKLSNTKEAIIKNPEIALREMQLETQKENLRDINKESSQQDALNLNKEKEETQKKIGDLQKELADLYKKENLDDFLTRNPNLESEYKLLKLQKESKEEEINKCDEELSDINKKLQNIRNILTNPQGFGPKMFMNQKELDKMIDKKSELEKLRGLLNEDMSEINSKIKRIEDQAIN